MDFWLYTTSKKRRLRGRELHMAVFFLENFILQPKQGDHRSDNVEKVMTICREI
jgi:hypothetical protein